jgi:hypothetical protein
MLWVYRTLRCSDLHLCCTLSSHGWSICLADGDLGVPKRCFALVTTTAFPLSLYLALLPALGGIIYVGVLWFGS